MELELSEGRIFGARYYTAKPILDWWVPGVLNGPNWQNMLEWCVETYGPTPEDGVWTPSGRWYANNAKFWFREKKDLEWFMLKWQ
jgi:hypothetical protein